MLVYYKYPKGSTILNGRRIYGFLELHAPVVIPWGVYKQHRNTFIQASYTKDILEQLFPGGEFPNLSFTYHEIRFMTWEQMCSLCKAFEITTSRNNGSRRRELRHYMKENC